MVAFASSMFGTATLARPARTFLCGTPLTRSGHPVVSRRVLNRGLTTATPTKMLEEGDVLPKTKELMILKDGKPSPVKLGEILQGKKAVVFAIPGALTPTCQEQHLPGFLNKVDELKSKGVDEVICLSVNDPFVLKAFAEKTGAAGKITMLGDGDAELVKGLGIGFDTGSFGGWRARRMSMIVDDGVVTKLNLEDGGSFEGPSKVETILSQL